MTTNAAWVLVVEDDTFVNKAYQTKFAFEEIPAQFALDGESALAMLREAGSKLPAVVLLDLMMPGMNGFEVLEQMKGSPKWKNIPVIKIGRASCRERV